MKSDDIIKDPGKEISMFRWISENLATIFICSALICIVAAIIFNMVKKKKNGESSCGCGCQGCSMEGLCHSSKTKDL